MAYRRKKALYILSIVMLFLFTFSILIGSGYAMYLQDETQISNSLYLPVVFRADPSKNVFGITLYTLDDAGGLPQAAQAGAEWTRNGFIWKAMQPIPDGLIDWTVNNQLDQTLINAKSLGVEPIMMIEGTPDWAWILKPGFNCGPVAETYFPTLANFAYELVKHYSVPPYNIHYWELWNEPDAAGIQGCWGDTSDSLYYGGYYYGQMLQSVYPKIKEADPNAQVLVGGLLLDCDPNHPPGERTCIESRFLNGILASGAGPYFDGVSFHAYDFYTGTGTYANPNWNSSSSTTGPVSIAKANYLRNVLSTYGYGQKYLMNTESAVFWGDNVLVPPCTAQQDQPELMPSIDETKVDYIVQSYAVALAEGWKANIWYSAFGVRCSGLLNSDLSPNAGYFAYQFTQQNLDSAQFIRQISEYPGLMGYEYLIPGKKLWVIWAMDSQAHQILLPQSPLKVTMMGANGMPIDEPINPNVMIDKSPIFIEFGK
jgi:hypothetical protein